MSGQYKNHSIVNFNERHFLKIHTETDVNFRQQSFDTDVKYWWNMLMIDEMFNETYLMKHIMINEWKKEVIWLANFKTT